MRYKKNIIIGVMCIAVLIMGLGYALLSTQIDISGSTAVTSTWKIEFSDIRTKELHGGATNAVTPTASGTTAAFEVDLVLPGDYVLYEIDITNYGDIDAEVKGATYSVSGSDAIYVNVDGIKKGTKLSSCEGLDTCPTITLTLKVGYDALTTIFPDEIRKDIEFNIEVGQYVEDNPTPESDLIPELKIITLSNKVFADNTVYADNVSSTYVNASTGINFGAVSSDTNGKGLYYTSTNTENSAMTYYFRGDVENNYVKFGKWNTNLSIIVGEDQGVYFYYDTLAECQAQVRGVNCIEIPVANVGADMYWRIVRVNEDGSIRMIYQGTSPNSTGANATIGIDYFGTASGRPNSMGYMYGYASYDSELTSGVCLYKSGNNVMVHNGSTETNCSTLPDSKWVTTAYAASHANILDSNAKLIIDNWYEKNLKGNYADFLMDSGFCADRSVAPTANTWASDDTALGYWANQTYYGAYNRLINLKKPQFACPQTNDLFTTSTAGKGNKDLNYPVGMITADEMVYAGMAYDISNTNHYLNIGLSQWSMTPYSTTTIPLGIMFSEYAVTNEDSVLYGKAGHDVGIYIGMAEYNYGIRPVINLKSCVSWVGGNGTAMAPYEVVADGNCMESNNGSSIAQTYTVSVSSNNTSYGTVSPSSQTVVEGGTAVITLTPASGYEYASNTCGGTISGNTLLISNITANKTCVITFAETQYTWEKYSVVQVTDWTSCEATDWIDEGVYCERDGCDYEEFYEDYFIEDGLFYETGDTIVLGYFNSGDEGYLTDGDDGICLYEVVGSTIEYSCTSSYTCEVIDETKGDYLGTISNTNRNAYPDNGVQDNYWYVFKES